MLSVFRDHLIRFIRWKEVRVLFCPLSFPVSLHSDTEISQPIERENVQTFAGSHVMRIEFHNKLLLKRGRAMFFSKMSSRRSSPPAGQKENAHKT